MPMPPMMANMEFLYKSLPEKTKESLTDSGSPQREAWKWLSNHPNITSYPEWRKTQIFALAAIFYSFEGQNWPEGTPALSRWLNVTTTECAWAMTEAEATCMHEQTIDMVGPDAYEEEDWRPCNREGQLHHLGINRLFLPENLKPAMPAEIGLLTSLKILGISYSRMNAKLSDWIIPELIQLPKLEALSLRSNGARGTIPKNISLMTHLRHLVIGDNSLTGSIPTEIAAMTSLECINVGDESDITGELPSELGLMTRLTSLKVYRSSVRGTIPTQLGSLSHLKRIYLDANQLSGAMPSELGLLTGNTWLALHTNHLTGSLPTELLLMTNTSRLRIWNNAFAGSIPSELGLMTNIIQFRLGNDLNLEGPHNDFTGSLPTALWGFSQMEELFLPNLPNLRGRIPSEITMPNLTILSLTGSPQISGTIPSQACLFVDELEFDCSDLLCGCDCRCSN